MLHHISQRQKVTVLLAVLSGLFLVALDQTIIATALVKIVEEFNSFSSLSWVITAYLLTSTITVPIAGKMSDMFGRRTVLLTGVALFVLSSFLSGSSQSIEQLIAYRALQGIGGGIIMSNAFAIIGDLFAPRERGRWMGLFGGIFGIASVIGPLLGGFLTEPHLLLSLTTNWRWTFWINVPIGIISFIIIAFYCPSITHEKKPSVDYYGSIFLAFALATVVLAADNTDKIFADFLDATNMSLVTLRIIMLSAAAIATGIFILIEKRAKEPILNLAYFKNRNFVLMMAIALCTGAAMLGSIIYLTQFNQQVFGVSPTQAGLMLLPLMAGIVTFSTLTGQIVSRTGHYKTLLVTGFAVSTLAIFSLAFITPASSYLQEAIAMFFTGVGIGVAMPVMNLAVQNEFSQRELGAVTAASQLFRNLGSTIGIAVFGGILTAGILANLGDIKKISYIDQLTKQPQSSQMLKKVDADTALNLNTSQQRDKINQVADAAIPKAIAVKLATSPAPQAIKTELQTSLTKKAQEDFAKKQDDFSHKVLAAFSDSLHGVFYGASALMLIGFAVSLFVKEKTLRSGKPDEAPGVA